MARHIYVHIPFCERKCPYCSFYSEVYDGALEGQYFDALKKEITSYASGIKEGRYPDNNSLSDDVDTVYFGGGTPTCVNEELVCSCLRDIMSGFDIKYGAEITIEANPNSLTAKKASSYLKAGFNRISIGVQSLNGEVLKTLGRLHDPEAAVRAVKTASEAGYKNISSDLIIGVPGQTYEGVIKDASKLVELGVDHISMYSLSIEEGTPFQKRYGNDVEEIFDPYEERRIYHGLRGYLLSEGFIPYEISNCARKGFESRHNNSYWEGMEYFSAGAGSHGYLNGKRFCHEDDIRTYIGDPVSINVEEVLEKEDKRAEYMMLMMRTSKGIMKDEFRRRFGVDYNEIYRQKIDDLLCKGLIIEDDLGIRLSERGLDFGNEVFREFL